MVHAIDIVLHPNQIYCWVYDFVDFYKMMIYKGRTFQLYVEAWSNGTFEICYGGKNLERERFYSLSSMARMLEILVVGGYLSHKKAYLLTRSDFD